MPLFPHIFKTNVVGLKKKQLPAPVQTLEWELLVLGIRWPWRLHLEESPSGMGRLWE